MKQNIKFGLHYHVFFHQKKRHFGFKRCRVFWGMGVILLGMLAGCASQPLRLSDANKTHQVIHLAKSLLGSAYHYGGRTPGQGFDCSGFVQYVYKNAVGIKLPRTSQKQFYASRSVQLGTEQPADLLFFDINGHGISHVGIYLGKGKFIHAPQSGGKVKISDANEKYWRKHFRGVRRLL